MPIIRIEKHHHNYVIIDKSGLEDDRLSLRARGMLAYLLTKPDDWEVSMRELTRHSPGDSRQTLTRTMQELEYYGYARRVLVRDKHGKLHGYQTFIYEKPLETWVQESQPITEGPTVGIPTVGQATVGQPTLGDMAGTKELNTTKDLSYQGLKETKHPPPPPSEGGATGSSFFEASAAGKPEEDASPAFASWWDTYPAHRRIHKKACYKTWVSKHLDDRSAEVLAHTAAMKRTKQWQEGKIPNSTTYLSQERYDTAPTERTSSSVLTDEFFQMLDEQGVHYERG